MKQPGASRRSPSGEPRGAREAFAAGRGLYLILTRPAMPHRELVAAAVEMAVPVVQLREKSMDDPGLRRLAAALVDLTRDSDTLFIINDRPDIARDVGADGAHVGTRDLAAGDARLILGPDAVLGVSGNSRREARTAIEDGADYLGIGPIFPTLTKLDAHPPVGLAGLLDVSAAVPDLPMVAVGGIDLANAASVVEAGASYVAVVSAICHAGDPVAAIAGFGKILRSADGRWSSRGPS